MARGKTTGARPDPADGSGPANDAPRSAYAGLSYRQGQAVEGLLQGQPASVIATRIGVHERTIRKWLGRPRFRAALFTARRESFSQAIGLTQRYAPIAVATLVKVMNDTLAPSSARVTAAAILLKFGREGIELDDLASRVEVLEQAAGVMAMYPKDKPRLEDKA